MSVSRIMQALVWLRRMGYSRGFGIQSPTDYHFVRYVINEHWPYYAYSTLHPDDDWLQRKLGLLYFRLVNWRQPATVIDVVGCADYLRAGCQRARVVDDAAVVELAVMPISADYELLFQRCDDASIVVFQDLWQRPHLWHQIKNHPRVRITFDLYYCGIVMFDSKRHTQHYIVNF